MSESDPYRSLAVRPPEEIETYKPAPSTLIRVNGSCCTCVPPGWMYRWWNEVALGDRWRCAHSGEWVWWQNYREGEAWQPATHLRRPWYLAGDHPMIGALTSLGWSSKEIPGYSDNLWTPPTPQTSGR